MGNDLINHVVNETVQLSTDVVKTTAKLAEAGLKKAWSLMDAASEKRPPSEYLSQNAIKAIQGIAQPSDK